MPNPYYVEELRPLTGNDKKIQDYVMKAPEAEEFLERVDGLIQFLLPNYVKEGKSSLVIAVGCTGGKHRSVHLPMLLQRGFPRHLMAVRWNTGT